MRKLILTLLVLLQTFFVFSQPFANSVTLYTGCNYSGKKYSLGVGNHRTYQMKVPNDKLASLKIPAGMKVTLYEHDKFQGRSVTYTSNTSCLPADWINTASSIVVESEYGNGNSSNNDFVVFYNDCYSQGYSQTLKPGNYTGNQLGVLKNNISSFAIFGNLQVKVYINNDNLSGYSIMHPSSVTCLGNNENDKIASLVIEYKPYNNPNNGSPGNTRNYATVYTQCNYGGNSLTLAPGYYNGEKLGLLKYNISSIEIPSNLRAKVFINNENMYGTSYTITENVNCLSQTLNNRIGSLIIEENWNNPPTYPNEPSNRAVVLYTDTYYKGQSISILPGTYASLSQVGFQNDALSSLTVPEGYRVVLYEHENFGGKTFTVTQSRTSFSLTGWNDRASSIAVYRDR